MTGAIAIRHEQAADRAAIGTVVRRSYEAVAHSDHREHLMVDRLREAKGFVPTLSLLAEIGDVAVGHILLTEAAISSGPGVVTTLALAPLSVVPEHQRRGVGRQLVAAAHRQARTFGHQSVLLVGPPGYYRQFGYQPLGRYPIRLPFDVPEEQRMILPLLAGALDGVAGMVRYPEGWLDH